MIKNNRMGVQISSAIDSSVSMQDNSKKLLYDILLYRAEVTENLITILQSKIVDFYVTTALEDRENKIVNIMKDIDELIEMFLKIIDDVTQYERMVLSPDVSICEENECEVTKSVKKSKCKKVDLAYEENKNDYHTSYIY